MPIIKPKLTIMMPSHNVGSRINVNILNASLLGSDDVEVIIRDNSGNENKRKFLSEIQEKNCRIMSVDECHGVENFCSLLNEAKGEFIFFTSDDDSINSHSIIPIVHTIKRIQKKTEIIGATGMMIIDAKKYCAISRFNYLNKELASERVKALFKGKWPSIFQYSTLRRSVLQDVWRFSSALPVYLSYHDLLINSLTLMHGRLVYIKRFLYHYHNGNWGDVWEHLESDARSFRNAGLDESGVRVQWLIAAFEGSRAFLRKYQNVQIANEERQMLASFWFNHFFQVFLDLALKRQAPASKFDTQALYLALKWRYKRPVMLDEVLVDIAEYYSLSSPEIAQRYYDFWK